MVIDRFEQVMVNLSIRISSLIEMVVFRKPFVPICQKRLIRAVTDNTLFLTSATLPNLSSPGKVMMQQGTGRIT